MLCPAARTTYARWIQDLRHQGFQWPSAKRTMAAMAEEPSDISPATAGIALESMATMSPWPFKSSRYVSLRYI